MTEMAITQAATSERFEHVPLSLPVPHVHPLSQQNPFPQFTGFSPQGLEPGVEGVHVVAPRVEHSEV